MKKCRDRDSYRDNKGKKESTQQDREMCRFSLSGCLASWQRAKCI